MVFCLIKMKNLIEKYNQRESLLVISSYPPKGQTYGKGVGGVASFAKNNLLPLSSEQRIVVLAEILDKPEIYEEENILVCRCWKRNFPGIYFDLLRAISKFSEIKQIEVQFEFALYGDLIITGFFPIFLGFLKFFGKQLVVVVHQVLLSLNSLSGHLGWQKSDFRQKFFSFILRWYYKFLAFFSEQIVVLEPVFKKRLNFMGINENKISVIRHGIDNSIVSVGKEKARQKLGIKDNEIVIMSFGFLTWYKGSDLLIESFSCLTKKFPEKKLRLILAGGESITQNKKSHYQKYVNKLYEVAAKNPEITITGFVPESKLKLFFGAADLVVLPYRTFMSSSAVLSLTLSFKKPFIVSNVLSGWFDGMEKNCKLPKFLFFKPRVHDLTQVMEETIFSKKRLAILSSFSQSLCMGRDYQVVGLQYQNLWFKKNKASIATAQQLKLATVE